MPAFASLKILVAVLVLTNSQLLTLQTTPVEIIPAPGVGKLIVPSTVTVSWNYVAPYTNTTASSLNTEWTPIEYNTKMSNSVYGFFNSLSGSLIGSGSYVSLNVTNTGLFIAGNALNGNLTGGDPSNTMTVKVYYYIVDL